jgi:hypothetical protein
MNALAPALNRMLLTSVLAEMKTPVVFEAANVAVSDGPLGMVGGVQLAAVFQSPELGLSSRSRCRQSCCSRLKAGAATSLSLQIMTAIAGADAEKALRVILMSRGAWCFS